MRCGTQNAYVEYAVELQKRTRNALRNSKCVCGIRSGTPNAYAECVAEKMHIQNKKWIRTSRKAFVMNFFTAQFGYFLFEYI